jgi:hypothetical protein
VRRNVLFFEKPWTPQVKGKPIPTIGSIPCREAPALSGSFNAILLIGAGFSSQKKLLSPAPSERFPVSHWVTFGQLKKQDPLSPKFQMSLARI